MTGQGANDPAPVALFVHNRPDHARQTLAALAQNRQAEETDLVIFSDGPRGDEDAEAVAAVRRVVAEASGFRSIDIRERPDNAGLAASIIGGVTEIVEAHGRVIVIEDDLVSHPGTLSYFNRCLDHFADHAGVFSISAYSHPSHVMPIPGDYAFDVYAIPRMQCWGWATWKDRWAKADFAMLDFAAFKSSPSAMSAYSHWIGGDSLNTLKACMRGEKDVWACRWVYAHFKHHAVCICPTRSLIDNIGLDGSGANCGFSDRLRQDVGRDDLSEWRLPDQAFVDPRLFEAFMNVMDPVRRSRTTVAAAGGGKPSGLVNRVGYWARRPDEFVRRATAKGRALLAGRRANGISDAGPDLEERHQRLSAPPTVPLKRLGTDYGGWWVPEHGLGQDDVMVSAGAGEDISFDLEVAKCFGCRIVVMDPTPRAIAHFEATRAAIAAGETAPINGSEAEAYDATADDMTRIVYRPWGLWTENTTLRFHAPRNPESVSHSIGNLQDTEDGFDAECLTLAEVLRREGHDDLALLKIDIEGAEFGVLDQLAQSNLRPRYILAEFHPGQSDRERVEKTRTLATLQRLHEVGYRIVQYRAWDYMLERQS